MKVLLPAVRKLHQARFQPYSKRQLQLESNLLGEILTVIASLSITLPQLNLTKLKHEYLKFGF